MTYSINAPKEDGSNWRQEAECLYNTIQVGQVDDISIGCMFSDIVLYVSLVVILSVILVKFALAVIFGWFLSWRLGTFKEEKSYAERMKREEQIENWTRNINTNGPVAYIQPPPQQQQKRKTFLPRQSRFTPVVHGPNRFDFERPNVPAWKA